MSLLNGITGGWSAGPIFNIGWSLTNLISSIGDSLSSGKGNLSDIHSSFDNGMDNDDDYLSSKPRYGNEHELKYWIASGGKEEDYWRYAENREASRSSTQDDIDYRFMEEGKYDPYSGENTGMFDATNKDNSGSVFDCFESDNYISFNNGMD